VNITEQIFTEFRNNMINLHSNIYFSFFAIAYIEQRPIKENLIFPKPFGTVTAESINKIPDAMFEEYNSWVRRHFIVDLLLFYEKYTSRMMSSHKNNGKRVDPSTLDEMTMINEFEKLPNLYSVEDILFIRQLRNIRNCTVHYNGSYSKRKPINYTFGTLNLVSHGHEGETIIFTWDGLLWMYEKLYQVISRVNENYFNNYKKR
jgi:hypothetical protein